MTRISIPLFILAPLLSIFFDGDPLRDCLIAAPMPSDPLKRLIDPADIYITQEQASFKVVAPGHIKVDNEVQVKLKTICLKSGLSNIFMIRSPDIESAVLTTIYAFEGGVGGDTPIRRNTTATDAPLWVVAYLGLGGSQPAQFKVKSAEVFPDKIRLTYEEKTSLTLDSSPYLIWIRIDKLPAEACYVELYNGTANATIMSRRVKIAQAK